MVKMSMCCMITDVLSYSISTPIASFYRGVSGGGNNDPLCTDGSLQGSTPRNFYVLRLIFDKWQAVVVPTRISLTSWSPC